MNPGPTEDAAKVVTSFFATMASQPLSLALVVMNLALLVLVGYIAHVRAQTSDQERTARKEMAQLFAQIVEGCRK